MTRTYNSLDDSSTILGNGWRLNYEMALTENADGSLTLIDADGSVKNFANYDRNGNFLTLTYDASARLQTVTDPFNRQLTFEYLTDKVVVTDPALRKIEYTLTSGNLSNVKADYKDLSENYVTEFASSYTYHPDGKIKEVIDPRGKKVTYGYTDNKLSSYTKDLTIYSPDASGFHPGQHSGKIGNYSIYHLTLNIRL